MMDEKVIEAKISDHDRHLDLLSNSIAELSSIAGQTNQKLDKVVEAINTQNVLIERMNNMDTNSRESFKRVHTRLGLAEEVVKLVPTSATIKWAVAIVVSYLGLSGNYLVSHIHELETKVEAHERSYSSFKTETTRRLSILDEHRK